jgi:hypothetical protein
VKANIEFLIEGIPKDSLEICKPLPTSGKVSTLPRNLNLNCQTMKLEKHFH